MSFNINKLYYYYGFFLLVFVITAFIVKVGFQPERLARYTPLVSLHGLFVLAWYGLFVYQVHIINTGNRTLHKKLGSYSIFLVVLMLVFSEWILINLLFETQDPVITIGNSVLLFIFLSLYVAAIVAAKRKQLEAHKRLMLFATIAMIGPAIARYIEVLQGSALIGLVAMISFIFIVPFSIDLKSMGKIHPVTAIAPFYVLGLIFASLALASSPFGDFVKGLAS